MSTTISTFDEAWRQERELLTRFAVRLCDGNYDVAEDLLQDTAIRAYRGYADFHQDSSFSTWCICIMKNARLNQVRSQRVQERIKLLNDEYVVPPYEMYEESVPDDFVLCLNAMRHLPEDRQEMLIQRYCDDLGILALAIAFKRPQGTVKSQISRAIQKARQYLAVGDLVPS